MSLDAPTPIRSSAQTLQDMYNAMTRSMDLVKKQAQLRGTNLTPTDVADFELALTEFAMDWLYPKVKPAEPPVTLLPGYTLGRRSVRDTHVRPQASCVLMKGTCCRNPCDCVNVCARSGTSLKHAT